MADPIEICEGAEISAEEVQRVEDAMALLAKDNHAARVITLTATLHVHHDFPKVLYKGKDSRLVADAKEEKAATTDGFGPYNHKTFNAPAKAEKPVWP
jgi:hypothetical protein